MKRTWMVGVVATGIVAAQAWAAPFNSKRVSASATWVVHADMEGLRQTQIGTFLVNQMNQGHVADQFAAFTAVFGFDPRKDLKTVTLYGKSKDPSQSVALVGGTFNAPHLVTLLKANNAYQSYAFGAHVIHSWIDDKKPAEGRQYGAFHPSGMIAVSHGLEMLQEALNVLDGAKAALDPAKAFGIGLPSHASFFAAGANMAGMGNVNSSAAAFSQAECGQLAFSEQDSNLVLNVTVAARDVSSASNMQAAAQGMLAVAQLGRERNPDLADLAQAARVALDGKTVRLDITCPVAKAIAMVEQGLAKKAEQEARRSSPPGQ